MQFFHNEKGIDLEEQKVNDLESIRDIQISDSFTLALSEEGQVYSWGLGTNGHLGHSQDSSTKITPQIIKFDFKEEDKKIKQIK